MRVSLEKMDNHPRRPDTSPVYRLVVAGGSHRGDPWKLSYLINQAEFDEMKTSVMEADNDKRQKS